jgi:hypothetical protein
MLVDPLNPDAWATVLGRLATEPKHVEAMRTKSIEQASQFSWSQTIAALNYTLTQVTTPNPFAAHEEA